MYHYSLLLNSIFLRLSFQTICTTYRPKTIRTTLPSTPLLSTTSIVKMTTTVQMTTVVPTTSTAQVTTTPRGCLSCTKSQIDTSGSMDPFTQPLTSDVIEPIDPINNECLMRTMVCSGPKGDESITVSFNHDAAGVALGIGSSTQIVKCNDNGEWILTVGIDEIVLGAVDCYAL